MAKPIDDPDDYVDCYCGYFWLRGEPENHRPGCPEARTADDIDDALAAKRLEDQP